MSGFKNYHLRYIKSVLYMLVALALIVLLVVTAIVNIPTKNVNEPTHGMESSTPEPENTNRIKIQLMGDIVLNGTLISSNSNAYGEYNFDSCFSS